MGFSIKQTAKKSAAKKPAAKKSPAKKAPAKKPAAKKPAPAKKAPVEKKKAEVKRVPPRIVRRVTPVKPPVTETPEVDGSPEGSDAARNDESESDDRY